MKIAVTGGNGFIGSYVCEEFTRSGHEVVSLSKNAMAPSYNANPLHQLKCDILDIDSLQGATKGFDCIVHLAALRSLKESMFNPFEYNRVNINGTVNVLEAARINGIKKVVFASSSAVYGNNNTLRQKEGSHLRPSSPYGLSKLAAEHYCSIYSENFGIETVSLRMFNVYGPGQKPDGGVIAAFIDAIERGKKPIIYGSGDQVRDFIYIKDIAGAFLFAMQNSKKCNGTAINIASGKKCTVMEVLGAIEKIEGGKIDFTKEKRLLGDMGGLVADISLAKKLLNWEPKRSLESGISQTLEWVKKRGVLL